MYAPIEDTASSATKGTSFCLPGRKSVSVMCNSLRSNFLNNIVSLGHLSYPDMKHKQTRNNNALPNKAELRLVVEEIVSDIDCCVHNAVLGIQKSKAVRKVLLPFLWLYGR
jgi:hypothetical protein